MEFEGMRINGVVVLVLVVATIASMWVTIYLAKRFPERRWLGIVLSIVFAPWGQLYLEGSEGYIMALVFITMFSRAALGSFVLPFVFSPIMMWYRFDKLCKTRVAEEKKEEKVIASDRARSESGDAEKASEGE